MSLVVGEFDRDTNYITDRITADGRDGYPVEPDRYRLIVARACPWANRAIIVRRLLGLEEVLSMGICGPTHDERAGPSTSIPAARPGARHRPAAGGVPRRASPDYHKGITVPAMVDVPTGEVVTNDFAQITLDFSTEWAAVPPRRRARALPEAAARRDRRGAARRHRDVNNGVYRCGFAGSQDAYDTALRAGCSTGWTGCRSG